MNRKYIVTVMGSLLVLCGGVYLGLKFYVEIDAKKRIEMWASQMFRFARFSYQTMDIGLFSKMITVDNISFQIKDTSIPIVIERLILYSFDVENEIPYYMHVEMKRIHLSMDHPFMKRMAPVMLQLGYSQIDADLSYAYHYDSNNKILEIQEILLKLSEAGKIGITAQISNLDIEIIKSAQKNPFMLISLVPTVAISRITIAYEDDSMMRKLIQMGAHQAGQSEEQFVWGLTQRFSQENLKPEQPGMVENIHAVTNFIQNPSEIHIVIAPRQPVPLMQFVMMDNIEQLIGLLNVSITSHSVR